MSDDKLLIYAPVPLHRQSGRLFVEDQAMIGLRRWSENFSEVTAIMPVTDTAPPEGWSDAEGVADIAGLHLHPVPMAYRPDRFFRALPATRRDIRRLIARHDYLSFAIGGLFGDWGAVACLNASRMGRPFAVWTDRVESEVTRLDAVKGSWRQRLRRRLTHRPMAWLERAVIRRAALGLFHGRETFETYAPYCRNPQVVHDILIARADHIAPEALERKVDAAGDRPLRIIYAGRAEPMKGPMDWLAVLEALHAEDVPFEATWLGDGSERAAMQARLAIAELGDVVKLPGFVSDREVVLEALRDAHVFLFCHKTPESPRNLIEALASGCPIIGYDGAYARDLIEENGGGQFVPIGDVPALAAQLTRLSTERATLSALMRSAYEDGRRFDDETVFRHRSDLIKAHLPAGAATMAG